MKAKNRYFCGCDDGGGKSQGAFVVFDKEKGFIKFIARKKWQIKILIFLAKIHGVKVLSESTKPKKLCEH